MGLDMYLKGSFYIGNKHSEDKLIVDGGELKLPALIEEVRFRVGYWRKANQIHQWFVENVQDGEDECKEYYVPFNKLMELKEKVVGILGEDNWEDKAEEELPTQDGFFFGSTIYDDDYRSDLLDTLDILNKVEQIHKNFENVDFYYRASW